MCILLLWEVKCHLLFIKFSKQVLNEIAMIIIISYDICLLLRVSEYKSVALSVQIISVLRDCLLLSDLFKLITVIFGTCTTTLCHTCTPDTISSSIHTVASTFALRNCEE